MSYPELKGRRAIVLVRCSTNEQPQSVHDQLDVCHRFAADNEMVVIDAKKYEGVSASVESNLDEIVSTLIRRKVKKNDFDCVLVHDVSRFARSGGKHAAKLRWELEQHRIEVIAAIGYVPPSPFSDVLDSIGAVQAHEQARSIAAASARGSQSSIDRGDRAHCTRTPYGVDRLVVGEDGRALFVLRNLVDGTQLRLGPQTGDVLERLPRRVGGASGHYNKARGQRIVLIPGEPGCVAIIRTIFRRYEQDGWGYHRIAIELNDRGIPSPTGSDWTISVVRQLLLNTTFCGMGLANTRTRALYYERSPGAPVDAKDRKRKASSGRPAVVWRQPEDWVWVEHERLAEFLPESIREKALARQKRALTDRAIGKHRKPKKDKHINSEFILKGILKTSDGQPMSGRRSGRNGKYRYYAASRAETAPKSGRPATRVRAEAIEEPILADLRKMLILMPHLRELVLEQSLEWEASRRGHTDRAALEQRLARLNRRIGVVLKLDIEDDEIEQQLRDMTSEKAELKQRLDAMGGLPTLDDDEVEHVVDALLDNLQMLGRVMGEFDAAALRHLVEVFVESAVVDLESKEATIVLRVPSWAMAEERMMGLGSAFDPKTSAEAHRFVAFELTYDLPKGYRGAA